MNRTEFEERERATVDLEVRDTAIIGRIQGWLCLAHIINDAATKEKISLVAKNLASIFQIPQHITCRPGNVCGGSGRRLTPWHAFH
jgi:hypothetical protein